MLLVSITTTPKPIYIFVYSILSVYAVVISVFFFKWFHNIYLIEYI